MLPKNIRIERKDFDQIMSRGKRYTSNSFILHLVKLNDESVGSASKFSFSVSKKVSKSAVKRNKLRRRGYSIIRKNLNSIRSGYFCFFLYKKDYQKDYKLLGDEIIKLLSSSFMII